MTAPVSARDALHRLIDELGDDDVGRLLAFARACAEDEPLTPEDEAAIAEGKAQIARGEFTWGEDIERELGL